MGIGRLKFRKDRAKFAFACDKMPIESQKIDLFINKAVVFT